jgi:hypothetical protein
MMLPILLCLVGLINQSSQEETTTMATFTTYDQVGKAEDVQDLITDISPTDCPMYSMIKPQKVHARVYEYQEDALN